MKLLLVLAFFAANFSHAHVNCLTSDANAKLDVVEKQNSNQSPHIEYFEKQNGNYVLKFKESVNVQDLLTPQFEPSHPVIEIAGNKSTLTIKISENLFKKQSAKFRINGKSIAFNCDIEN